MTSLLRALRAAIEESTLVRLVIAPDSRQATLRVEALGDGTPGGRRTWTFALGEVSHVAAWLREIRYADPGGRAGLDEPEDVFPPEEIAGLHELNGWLASWSGHTMYGHAGEAEGTEEPQWLGWASIDLAWPGGQGRCQWVELWLGDNPVVGPRVLDVRVEFGGLALIPDEEGLPPGYAESAAPGLGAPPAERFRAAGGRAEPGGTGQESAGPQAQTGGGSGRRAWLRSGRPGSRRRVPVRRRWGPVAALAAAAALGLGGWLAGA